MAQIDGQFVSNSIAAETTQNCKTSSVSGSGGVVVASTTTPPPPPPSSSSANSGSGSKKLRRAFSMPRNPFRLSRRFKTGGVPVKDLPNTGDTSLHTGGAAENGAAPVAAAAAASIMHGTEVAAGIGDNSTAMSTTASASKTNNNKNRLFRRTSWKKFLSRIAQQMTSINIGAKHTVSTDRVPPLGGYQWPPDQTPGVTGLKNHGNTCFMNAVLQCLSHTDIIAEYFVLDQYKADLKRRNKLTSRKFGTKGELTEQLALVLKALWTCKIESDYSTSFKAVVDRYGTQFRSSTQHDAQEFLFWLLDKVHEDLNTASKRKYKSIKNSYGRSDEAIAAETLANHIRCNNSFVQAVFQAQFRSSLACPRCHKQSNTFDPFHCISVQLPQLAQQAVFVTVLYATQHPRQVKLGLGVPPGSPIVALREQLQADTDIPLERIILAEITETGFGRVFCDSHPMSSLSENDPIYCIETAPTATEDTSTITLVVTNVCVQQQPTTTINTEPNKLPPPSSVVAEPAVKRFGTPFCVQVCRDVSYTELQKKLLKEMQTVLKSEVFAYSIPLTSMFRIRLQDPSADPDTYIEPTVEHPLFTEMIDLALSVLPSDVGPAHVKILLEWTQPENYFADQTDPFVEHESVSQFREKFQHNPTLTLEQCLEHYTKAETLSAEDAWRCPNCQKYLPVVKTLGLWSLPDILVIHFKRFRQQHIKGPQAAKLTTTVRFPLNNFDMTPHLARGSGANGNNGTINGGGPPPVEDNWSPWRKMRRRDNHSTMGAIHKDNRYDLYSVCYHQGDTLETGHYTAACKNPYDHQWYKFDDQKVTQVPANCVPEEIVNNEAYMLFYQRRKFDNMECSGTSSTSGDHWVSKIAAAPPSSGGTPANSGATTTATSKNASTRASIATLSGVEEKDETVTIAAKGMILLEEDVRSGNASPVSTGNVEKPTPVKSVEFTQQIEVNVEINSEASVSSSPSLVHVPQPMTPEIVLKIRKTSENEIVDIESISDNDNADRQHADCAAKSNVDPSERIPDIDDKIDDQRVDVKSSKTNQTTGQLVNGVHALPALAPSTKVICRLEDGEIRRKLSPKHSEVQLLSASVPTQRSLWSMAQTPPPIQRGSLNFNEMLSNGFHADPIAIRHSIASTAAAAAVTTTAALRHQQTRDNASETISMIRGANSCSKDTLMFIDQPGGHCLLDDDRSHYGNKSLWISPVTPHKLITVSPKN